MALEHHSADPPFNTPISLCHQLFRGHLLILSYLSWSILESHHQGPTFYWLKGTIPSHPPTSLPLWAMAEPFPPGPCVWPVAIWTKTSGCSWKDPWRSWITPWLCRKRWKTQGFIVTSPGKIWKNIGQIWKNMEKIKNAGLKSWTWANHFMGSGVYGGTVLNNDWPFQTFLSRVETWHSVESESGQDFLSIHTTLQLSKMS